MAIKLKNHHVTALSGSALRVLSALLQLLIIRSLIKTLGQDSYAQFAVLIGLFPWFVSLDYGLGNSLQNEISIARAKGINSRPFVPAVLKRVLAYSTITSFVLVGSSYLLLDHISFLKFFRNDFIGVALYLVLSIFGSVLSVVAKINLAQMRGYLYHLLNFVNILIAYLLVSFVLPVQNIFSNLNFSVLAYFGPAAVLGVIISLWYIFKDSSSDASELSPDFRKKSRDFFIFAILSNMVLQVDYAFLGSFSTEHEILKYNAVSKVFAFFYFFYSALLQSLWPVFSEAFELNELEKIRSQFKNNILLGVFAVILFSVIFFVYQGLVFNYLLGLENFKVETILFLTFSVYFCIRVWTDMYGIFLQSSSHTQYLWRHVPVQAVLSIVFQYLLVSRYGALGSILGLSLSYVLSVSWLLPYEAYRILKMRSNI
jgi:O-antigen/teichoic acid export membrane protein